MMHRLARMPFVNRATTVVASLAAMLLAPGAIAQRPLDTGQPQWTIEELRAFLDAADLTDTPEAQVLLDLHASLAAAHRRAMDEFRQRNAAISERQREWHRDNPGNHDPWRDFGIDFGWNDSWTEYRESYRAGERQFLADVESVVGESRRETWLAWRRDVDRRHLLQRVADGWRRQEGFRSLMNLTDLIDSIDLDAPARRSLLDVEHAYAREMEAATSNWHDWETRFHHDIIANTVFRFEEGTPTADAKRGELRRAAAEQDARLARIVDVNDRTIALIRGRLAPDAAIRFQDAVDAFRHPSVFLPCPVELAMKAMETWDSATDAQHAAGWDVWTTYDAEHRALRRRIVMAFDEWESPQWVAQRRAAWVESFATALPGAFNEDTSNHPARPHLRRSLELAREATIRLLDSLGGDEGIAAAPLALRIALHWWEEEPAVR